MSYDLLGAYGWQGIVLLAWVGLSIGSFLNVVIYRTPVMLDREWREQAREILADTGSDDALPDEDDDTADATPFNLAVPRSRCPSCGHEITALENIPVLSWLFLRGKCSGCGTSIAARYPTIELLTGLLTLTAVAAFGFNWMGLAVCVFTWMLIALAFIDYDTKYLPDQITYPLLWLGLMTQLALSGIVPLHDAVIGAVVGYLFLWGTYWVFKLLTGKEGMGYGDFKLFAALGAWLGWQALPSIILIAAVLGLAFAGLRIFTAKQSAAETIPFGPFLAAAGWVTMIFRDSVLGVFLP